MKCPGCKADLTGSLELGAIGQTMCPVCGEIVDLDNFYDRNEPVEDEED